MVLSDIATRKGKRYKVEFMEGGSSTCSAKVVDNIVNEIGEQIDDEEITSIVAVMVARLQTSGDSRDQFGSNYRRFNNSLIMEKLPKVIEIYGLDASLEIITNLRNYEIERLLNSRDIVDTVTDCL